jgi:flagellar hook-basal body complex protein FliE
MDEGKDAAPGFAEAMRGAVDEVNSRLVAADRAVAELVGGGGNIHETMIALEKADVSFRLLTRVQSKAVAAYQEIMRMQL